MSERRGGDWRAVPRLRAVAQAFVSWQIPLAPQESIVVETSGELGNWIPYLVLSAGKQVEWTHHGTITQRYFRLVPND